MTFTLIKFKKSRRRRETGVVATQSPGKLVILPWHDVSAGAGTGGRWLEAAAPARSVGQGWKCLGFKVTGSPNEAVNQRF